jgi:hypothetical protein
MMMHQEEEIGGMRDRMIQVEEGVSDRMDDNSHMGITDISHLEVEQGIIVVITEEEEVDGRIKIQDGRVQPIVIIVAGMPMIMKIMMSQLIRHWVMWT